MKPTKFYIAKNASTVWIVILVALFQATTFMLKFHVLALFHYQHNWVSVAPLAGYALAFYLSPSMAKLPAVFRVVSVVAGSIVSYCLCQFIICAIWLFGCRLIYGVYPLWGHE